jgi:hypothetical protein
VTTRIVHFTPFTLQSNITANRYLFLFADVLLVVKEKSASSYKLKEKIRVADLWFRAESCSEVGRLINSTTNNELNSQMAPDASVDTSLLLGWPTCNWVVTFW